MKKEKISSLIQFWKMIKLGKDQFLSQKNDRETTLFRIVLIETALHIAAIRQSTHLAITLTTWQSSHLANPLTTTVLITAREDQILPNRIISLATIQIFDHDTKNSDRNKRISFRHIKRISYFKTRWSHFYYRDYWL